MLELAPVDVASADTFRAAFASLPSPVTLVTSATLGGDPVGATVSAFSSLSLDPPLVTVSLDHESSTLAAIRQRTAFAVHVLGDSHRSLALHFASKTPDKFDAVAHTANGRGVPLLDSYVTRFECRLVDEFPGGDHTILVGLVESLAGPNRTHRPVVWMARTFRRVDES